MSHWHHTMVDGSEFWIGYQRLAFLSGFSRWQLIQKSATSTIVWCQCDIRITFHYTENHNYYPIQLWPEFRLFIKYISFQTFTSRFMSSTCHPPIWSWQNSNVENLLWFFKNRFGDTFLSFFLFIFKFSIKNCFLTIFEYLVLQIRYQ